MFLHLSVIPSVHGGGGEGGGVVKECAVKGVCCRHPHTERQRSLLRPRGRHPPDPEADTLPRPQKQTSVERATETGGTHPTGMHSC